MGAKLNDMKPNTELEAAVSLSARAAPKCNEEMCSMEFIVFFDVSYITYEFIHSFIHPMSRCVLRVEYINKIVIKQIND